MYRSRVNSRELILRRGRLQAPQFLEIHGRPGGGQFTLYSTSAAATFQAATFQSEKDPNEQCHSSQSPQDGDHAGDEPEADIVNDHARDSQ